MSAMEPAMHRLMTVDASPGSNKLIEHGPLEFAASWTEASEHAGRALADLSRDRIIERGRC